MTLTTVTRTYLEMTSPAELRPAATPTPTPKLERVAHCSVALFRFLYKEVGRVYQWTERSRWSDEEISTYLADPAVSIWVLSFQGIPAGYFQLKQETDGAVEIEYFGLLGSYIGRGWGKYLLTQAVEAAWKLGANRVWLHTCTLDHPAALPNYLKRGFRAVRTEVYHIAGKRAGG